MIYAIWLLYTGRDYILPSAARYRVLIPLFMKARREAGAGTLMKPFEWVVLGVLAVMTVVFIVQVATGTSGF